MRFWFSARLTWQSRDSRDGRHMIVMPVTCLWQTEIIRLSLDQSFEIVFLFFKKNDSGQQILSCRSENENVISALSMMSRNINNFFTWADPRTKYESHIFPLQQILVNSTRKKKKRGCRAREERMRKSWNTKLAHSKGTGNEKRGCLECGLT